MAKAAESHTAVDVLVEQVAELAPVSYSPAPVSKALPRKPGSSQSAVLMFSDSHIGAVVRPDQTLGFGKYDFPTFLRRLKRLETSIISILQDHTATPVDELVIPLIGDVLDGSLTHGAEAGQMNTLFSQFYGGGHAIAQFLRNLSAVVPKIRVYSTQGNHPRMPNQHKCPTKNAFSNFDTFIAAYIQALVRDIPGIDVTINTQPMAEFQVRGYNFLAAHGTFQNGGDKSLGIPAHAFGRMVSATTQLRAKTGRPAIHFYCYGHHHRPMVLPHSLGRILVNGSFVGIDEFAMALNFSAAPPVQKFFLMHSKYGMAASYDLDLSFAPDSGPVPYEVPGVFPVI